MDPEGGALPEGPHPPPASPPPPPSADVLLGDLVRALEREAAERPDDAQLRERLVLAHVMRRDWPAAALALAKVEPQDDTWRLIAAAVEGRVGENADAAAFLEEVRRRWRAAAPLRIRRAVLCREILGFGRFDPLPPGAALAPGDTLLVYLEIDNAVLDLLPSGRARLRLQYGLELLDADGRRVPTPEWDRFHRPDEVTVAGYVNDIYGHSRADLPAKLAPGTYTLRVTATDTIGAKQATATVEIPVKER